MDAAVEPFPRRHSARLASIAHQSGVAFENYLEAQRNGRLFARTGSTVLGGHHHQQFNYLNAAYNVKYIILGQAPLFRSSIAAFQAEILVESNNLADIYSTLLARAQIKTVEHALFAPTSVLKVNGAQLEIAPYLFPEIYYRKALGFPASAAAEAKPFLQKVSCKNIHSVYLTCDEQTALTAQFPNAAEVDTVRGGDNYGAITLRIAERWKPQARALAFADPPAILSQLPKLCRESRLTVYAPHANLEPFKIVVNAYQEETTTIAREVIQLATDLENLVMVGRQTTDADLLEWAKGGVCLQIMDPNRPAFPLVETMPHVWTRVGGTLYDGEPDDATLRKYAEEKILITILFHSGEMAHNEAIINFFDLVCFTGVKMGIGVHAARYETAPQLWKLLNIPRERGVVRSFVEPVLYSGGMGIMAEINCPPQLFQQHCVEALSPSAKSPTRKRRPKAITHFSIPTLLRTPLRSRNSSRRLKLADSNMLSRSPNPAAIARFIRPTAALRSIRRRVTFTAVLHLCASARKTNSLPPPRYGPVG